MAKMIDVARHAGVSIKTVSRVLNNEPHVQDALREKVRQSVRELGYTPSASARSLRSNRSYTIHMACHVRNSGFVHAIQFGALEACQIAGYSMVVSMLDEHTAADEEQLRDWCKAVSKTGKPDGLILVPPLSTDPLVKRILNEFEIRTVRVGPDAMGDSVAKVEIDDREAAREATRYLIKLGHRRIGFIRGKEEQESTPIRYAGYCDALNEANIEIDDSIVFPGLFDFESGLSVGEKIFNLDNPPSAVFASNDDMAAGVLVAAHRENVSVPEKMSIIGFDDSEIATKMWPTLTTIRQPLYELGAKAAEMLVAMAGQDKEDEAPTYGCLPYELVVRQSTAPYAG